MSLRVSADLGDDQGSSRLCGVSAPATFRYLAAMAAWSTLGRRVSMIRPDRRPTILVIDDQSFIRRVVRRALEPEMAVLEAGDGEEGLILLDRLVVTGFAAMGFREAAAAYGVPILQKPFDVQALATGVREALSQGPRRIRPDRGTGPPSTMSLVEAANTLRKSASASC